MANWLRVTSLPLIDDGAISAIYMGDTIEARPTPNPPIILNTLKTPIEGANAVKIVERPNNTDEKNNAFFLPKRSQIVPPNMAPKMQPIWALLITKPRLAPERLNSCFINITAPDIIEISYPNKNPPTAATREIR